MRILYRLKVFVLSALLIPVIGYPDISRAEYYLSNDCGTYVCRYHHVHKRHCPRSRHYRTCSTARIDVYFVYGSQGGACGGCAAPPAPVSACCGGGYMYADGDLDGSSVTYAYTDRMDHYYPEEHYYYNTDPYYNPDLATGDDPGFVDPELQVSYQMGE